MTANSKKILIDKFYFDKDTGLPDINNYGKYRLGLTPSEIQDYIFVIAIQTQTVADKRLLYKFYNIAGPNTCAVVDGIVVMYRHDVQRYTDKLFNGTPTYFD